jgi:hypothetical protein
MHVYHEKLKQQALDAVVKEALTAVIMCIQKSSVFFNDFKSHHPRARELCDWLQTHNMSSYTGVIARHGISSVYALSLLDVGSAVPVLADDLSCCETRMQSIATLTRAVSLAKSSELSLPLSVRLNRFIDSEASVLSAMYSSCVIDAALYKQEIIFFAFFCAASCACLGAFTLRIVDEPFLSISYIMNPLLWFIMSACFLFLGAWPVAFGGSVFEVLSTDFKPRNVIACALICIPFIWTIIIVYIKAARFGSISFGHSILYEAALRQGALTTSYDTCYLYEFFVMHSVQCIGLFMGDAFIYSRQELAFRTMILALLFFTVFASFGFSEIITIDNRPTLRFLCALLSAGLSLTLVTFQYLNAYSKSKAADLLKHDDAACKKKWEVGG